MSILGWLAIGILTFIVVAFVACSFFENEKCPRCGKRRTEYDKVEDKYFCRRCTEYF
jgi:hypothetical protein